MELLKKSIIWIFTAFMVALAVFLSFNRGVAFYAVMIDFLTVVRINFLLQLAETTVLFIVVFMVCRYVIGGSRRTTVILLSLSFILKLVWVLNFPIDFYFDMNSVMDNASYFLGRNGYDSLYMTIYPFNNVISLIDSIYLRFTDTETAFMLGRIVNVVMMTVTEFTIYRITTMVSNRKTANFTLLIMLVFFPLTGYLVVVYNDMYALMFITLAIYHFICLVQSDRLKDLVLTVLFLLITNWFRSIGMIFFIAFSLYYLLMNYRKALKFILIAAVSLIAMNLVSNCSI